MTTKTLSAGLATLSVLAMLSACGQQAPEMTVSIYEEAISNSLRTEEDRARDAGRMPAEVLEFIGIDDGMCVLDMFSGGGWYSEIIAHVVGEKGMVVAHSNEAYKNFVGDALEERFANGRVPQAEILMAENNQLSLDENKFDAVFLALSFHDMYHVDVDNGWELLDGPAFLAELRNGLKPGGIVGIVDHYAETGAAAETGNTLHRIDPALVISTMEAAGFLLEAQSDILRNPDDDLGKIVFAPDLRGKTDRFVMRFRNPE